jgi:hypothetical protein
LTGLRLCVTGRNSEPATSAICPCTPDFGAARCADRACTTCQHFPGGQALNTRANGEEGLGARGRHPGGRRCVVHSPVHQQRPVWCRIRWPAGCGGCCQERGG